MSICYDGLIIYIIHIFELYRKLHSSRYICLFPFVWQRDTRIFMCNWTQHSQHRQHRYYFFHANHNYASCNKEPSNLINKYAIS